MSAGAKANFSAAFGVTAGGAGEAAILIYKAFLVATLGTQFSIGMGSIGDVAFQCPDDPVFPCVDVVLVQCEVLHQVNGIGEGHSVAQDSGNKLGIVPVFLVKRPRKAFNGNLIALFVFKLEVIAGFFAFVFFADHISIFDPGGGGRSHRLFR